MENAKKQSAIIKVSITGFDKKYSHNVIELRKDNSTLNTKPQKIDNQYLYEVTEPGNYKVRILLRGISPSEEPINVEEWGEEQKVYHAEFQMERKELEKGINIPKYNYPLTPGENAFIDTLADKTYKVELLPTSADKTDDTAFWQLILKEKRKEFAKYQKYIDGILSFSETEKNKKRLADDELYSNEGHRYIATKRLPFHRTESYSLLKYATEKYVEWRYSINFEKPGMDDYVGDTKVLPYLQLIREKLKDAFLNENESEHNLLHTRFDGNLIELIWNYWHEEGMVSQTMYALARRFQNIKSNPIDPLSNFDLDPLRPLNNILWGYIQDTQHRLGLQRRNLTYQQLYGWSLAGVKEIEPADKRSNFQQSFHRLILEATEYFELADNTTIKADGFKVLNALTDTHRILAEGAHNQFGDLPFVARTEMLIEQWILSRPEVREFLGGKIMVPYKEPWMDRVDTMKSLQGWDRTNISFYNDLAVYGEKIILSVRYGSWTEANRDMATNWANTFRDAIQKYVHSYHTVTGLDLSAEVVSLNPASNYLLPGALIRQKLLREKSMSRRF